MIEPITTHILNLEMGKPATEVTISLLRQEGSDWLVIETTKTDANGRATFTPDQAEPGVYRLLFATGDYFAVLGQDSLYPSVSIDFRLNEPAVHYHIPLLLNRFGYSTYRGN